MGLLPFRRTDRTAPRERDLVAVYVSRDDVRTLDSADLGNRVAAAVERRGAKPVTIPEFEPVPTHTVQDVLHGHITWDELR
ncbi:hypothetical protein [Actinosynnema sp. NPDC020468]|uniref:hypothetical protein n=1 Tax=Actinosynnema sp. NPDC020468 TaxID=3154488 RepID=UPI00340AF30F